MVALRLMPEFFLIYNFCGNRQLPALPKPNSTDRFEQCFFLYLTDISYMVCFVILNFKLFPFVNTHFIYSLSLVLCDLYLYHCHALSSCGR